MRPGNGFAMFVVAIISSGPGFAACTPPRYATQLAEAAGELRLEAQSTLLRGLANSLRSALGDDNSVAKASIGGRYAIAAAGGLASSAYSETLDDYFCVLGEKLGADATKKALLNKERLAMRATLLKYFDAGRWQPENTEARDKITDALIAETSAPPLFNMAEIDAALPDYNFDTLKISEIFGGVKVGDLVGVGACGGLVYRSIRQIDPSVLADLQLVPVVISKWLAGDRASAKLDMWTFVSSQMSKQLTTASNIEKLTIDKPLISCIDNAAQAAEQKMEEKKADGSAHAVLTLQPSSVKS
ncbi:hypothetical protein SAMN05444678_102118 [Sphingomonas sp. YR710]|nr:hypothetical protein SAMN05444678_102118 [Sphingomonas sp. YR710]